MGNLHIFLVFVLENMCVYGAREKQYMRKSLYYPYKTTHKSIYLKYRRHDYDYLEEPTSSIYLPNFNKTLDTNETLTESETVSPSAISPSDLNYSDITSVSNINDPSIVVSDTTIVVTTNKAISDINANLTTTFLSNDDKTRTTREMFNETEKLIEETSTIILDTSSIISPPTFEAYSPGTIQKSNTSVVVQTTTQSPIKQEIKELSKKYGYFSASSVVLLETFISMNGSYVKCFLATLNTLIQRLDREDRFSIFGGKPAEIIMSGVQALATEPADVMKDHFQFAIYGIENRQNFLQEDTNTLLDIIDTVYLERDGEDIAVVVEEIKSSDCSNSIAIAEDFLRVFLLIPFQRIEGAARQHVISSGIKHIIESRFKDMILH